jgi:hypothetical protein
MVSFFPLLDVESQHRRAMPQVTTWTRFVNQAALDAHLETLGDGTYVRRHFNRDENPARIEFQPGRLIRTEHTVNDELKVMWQFMLMDEPNNIQPFVVTDRRTPKTCHFVDVTAAPNDDPHAGEHRTARRRSETRAAEEDELVGFSEDAVAAAVRAERDRRARAAAPPAAVAQAAAPIAIDAAEQQVPGQARRPRQEDADMYHQIDERRRLDDVRREAATLLAGVPQPPHGHQCRVMHYGNRIMVMETPPSSHNAYDYLCIRIMEIRFSLCISFGRWPRWPTSDRHSWSRARAQSPVRSRLFIPQHPTRHLARTTNAVNVSQPAPFAHITNLSYADRGSVTR